MNQSIKTISSPEFINLQPLEINPLMSACEIKVLYVGENRNHTFISKETATEMAKTLMALRNSENKRIDDVKDFIMNNKPYIQSRMLKFVRKNIELFY